MLRTHSPQVSAALMKLVTKHNCTFAALCAIAIICTPLTALAQAKDIVVTSNGSCAVTTAGALECWGAVASALGTGTMSTEVRRPAAVLGATSSVNAATTTGETTCVIGTDASVKCRGEAYLLAQGQTFGPPSATFLTVASLAGASQVSLISGGNPGALHACAVTSAGGVKCCGTNQFRQLGSTTGSAAGAPVDVVGLASGVAEVHGGRYFTCARTTA